MKLDRPVIKLKTAERKRCEAFADARCDSDTLLYKKRGGFKKEDIVAGAMAEIAVYHFLRSYGIKVGKPDFTIYEVGKKSYEADLICSGKEHQMDKKYHVKGQTYASSQLYGESWLMQKKDPLVKQSVNIINNYLVPCIVDMGGNNVYILGIPSFTALHSHNCFSHPKLEWMRTTKVAIYGETLNCALTDNAKWGMLRKKGKWKCIKHEKKHRRRKE